MHRDNILRAAVVLAMLFVFASVPATADEVQYTLDTLNGAAGNYGTVDLKLNADKTITVTVNTLGHYQLKGNGNSNPFFAFNSDVAHMEIRNISAGTTKSTGPLYSTQSVGSGLGTFDYSIQTQTGSWLGKSLTFTLTGQSTEGFKSVKDLGLENNGAGNLFALNVGSGWATGHAVAPTPTPEPTSLALLGTGLVTIGGFVRRWRKKNTV